MMDSSQQDKYSYVPEAKFLNKIWGNKLKISSDNSNKFHHPHLLTLLIIYYLKVSPAKTRQRLFSISSGNNELNICLDGEKILKDSYNNKQVKSAVLIEYNKCNNFRRLLLKPVWIFTTLKEGRALPLDLFRMGETDNVRTEPGIQMLRSWGPLHIINASDAGPEPLAAASALRYRRARQTALVNRWG